MAYGRTSDNVSSSSRRRPGPAADRSAPDRDQPARAAIGWSTATSRLIRTEFGRFGRQVSGYSLEHLLPENGRHLARALVGSEGTLGRGHPGDAAAGADQPGPALVVLGYPSMADAADAVAARCSRTGRIAVEGLDARIVDIVRRARGAHAVPELPRGGGWLMVEVGGDTAAEARPLAAALVAGRRRRRFAWCCPPARRRPRLWRIRADGAGLGRTHPRRPAGLARLGGRRRPARPARRVPARVRGAAGRRTV